MAEIVDRLKRGEAAFANECLGGGFAEAALGVWIGRLVVRTEGCVHLASGAADGIQKRRDEEGVL